MIGGGILIGAGIALAYFIGRAIGYYHGTRDRATWVAAAFDCGVFAGMQALLTPEEEPPETPPHIEMTREHYLAQINAAQGRTQ